MHLSYVSKERLLQLGEELISRLEKCKHKLVMSKLAYIHYKTILQIKVLYGTFTNYMISVCLGSIICERNI